MDEDETPETPFTFPLKVPVDGVSEITLRELTADEIAKFNDDRDRHGAIRALKNIIAQISRVDVATVGKMGSRDFNACSKYLLAFFD